MEEEIYALHKDEKLTKREYLDEMANCARFTLGTFTGVGYDDIKSNCIMANEYADFKEFLSERLDDFDELFEEFIIRQGTANINGYKKHGYLLEYEFPVVVGQ